MHNELVAPMVARSQPQLRRLVVAAAALLALAACVVVAVSRSDGSPSSLASAQLSFGDAAYHTSIPAAVREGSVRGQLAPKFTPPGGDVDEYGLMAVKGQQELAQLSAKEQSLAFGDSKVVKDEDASSREGSVRNGVKPDFEKPLGDLGEVGLAKKAAAGGLHPVAMPSKTQALAFGDAKMVKDAAADSREGSVRHGVKPDFSKPLGTLGETGLASKPLKQQQLAFGDAKFVAGANKADREGSVRGNIKPDFQKPLGDLGETGLAAAKGGKKLSAAAARNAMAEFYNGQAKELESHKAPELTAKAAVAQLAGYFNKLASKDAEEHSVEQEKALKDEKSQKNVVSKYYTKLQAADAQQHKAAVSKEHAQDAAVASKEDAVAHRIAALEKTHGAAAAHASKPAAKAGKAAQAKVDKSEKQARAQALAGTPLAARLSPMTFSDREHANKHGFHSHSMARDPTIKKEMAEARKIAQEDVDDAME